MEKILSVLDRRRSYVKHTINLGRSQMIGYFQARYSWGQSCGPRRAYDWGVLCAYLKDCSVKGLSADFSKYWVWPSGNKGSISGLMAVYHDSSDLLSELGLLDDLNWV